MYSILLVDDEAWEKEFIGFSCQKILGDFFELDHALRGSEATKLLLEKEYDLILLDNNLSGALNAKFTVPFLKECAGRASIAIISNNIQEDYLVDPSLLGVDYIIDKKQLETFLEKIKTNNFNPISYNSVSLHR